MKVIIREYESSEYPCIKYLKVGDRITIALFSDLKECTILNTSDPGFIIGRSYKLSNPGPWKRFNGEVTIQND